MTRLKVGLILVGFGETIADFGARLAGCVRQRSYLYPRTLVERDAAGREAYMRGTRPRL